MTLDLAPLFHDIADAPEGGEAYWLTCPDAVRIRLACWRGKASTGTVLLMPGRTEYIEKYGRAAAEFVARGYDCIVIDWRGQGLADRLLDNSALGHVGAFSDYQTDLGAVLDAVVALDLPTPLHLFAHSMGGAIGLRALLGGLDVASATFSGPMWGIELEPARRAFAWVGSSLARKVGLAEMIAPGTVEDSYVLCNPFEDNMLTKDPEMFEWMRAQLHAHPELGLGGPTMHWINEALRECRNLRAHPTPDYPCLCFLGTDERIVAPEAIRDRMARWTNGTLVTVEQGEHEVAMEVKPTRDMMFDRCAEFFAAHSTR